MLRTNIAGAPPGPLASLWAHDLETQFGTEDLGSRSRDYLEMISRDQWVSTDQRNRSGN